LRLSTIILEPIDAITKKPIVIIQHKTSGQTGNNKCSDSAVAQQLTAANATNAQREKIFKNLFCSINL
jgi:hypothetical protein